ncbi:hypothetical protein V8E54_011345 [Elaphomyces granulatus]
MNSISPPRDRRTGPYDADFKDMLIQGRIYPNGYEYSDGQRPQEPNNLDEVVQRLSQPQPALESTVSNRKFQEYFNANLDASNETDAKPNYYYGSPPEKANANVRKTLSRHIVPSSSRASRKLPMNFFIEVTGPTGPTANPEIAQRQAW